MVVVQGNILQVLSFDCFAKYVENTLCFTAARIASLTGISFRKLSYWEEKDFLNVPASWDHFGKPSCKCKNFHLPQIKMAFAVEIHLTDMMALADARARVAVHAATAALWERNYEERWRKTFRANLLLRRGEVIGIINHFTPDFLTKEHLVKWIDESFINTLTPRKTGTACDQIDLYELYALYISALTLSKYPAGKLSEATLTLYTTLGNDIAEKAYNIDCNIEKGYLMDYAPQEIVLPGILEIQKLMSKKTTKKLPEPAVVSSKDLLHDFLHSKFPDYLTIENIQAETRIDETELLDLIDEMGDNGFLDKRWSKIENAFAFRTALDKMNK